MRNGTWVSMLAVVGALSANPALAQDETFEPAVIRNVERTVERTVFGKETGHDKCVGSGHENSRGGGHEAGECEEQEEARPSGPVSEAVCAQTIDESESAWRRYACTLTAYNEAYLTENVEQIQADGETATDVTTEYVTRSLESNEDYGTRVIEYAGATADPDRLVANVEAAVEYGGLVLNHVGDGGNILDGAGPLGPPLPRREDLEGVVVLSADLTSTTEYLEDAANYVFNTLGDGGNILDGAGPLGPPLPRREETNVNVTTAGMSVSYGATSASVTTSPITDYSDDFSGYTDEYVDNVLVGASGGDGGNILDGAGPLGPPLPRREELDATMGAN